jgi:hypothetical protein
MEAGLRRDRLSRAAVNPGEACLLGCNCLLLLPSSLHCRQMTLNQKSLTIKAPMAEHIEDLQQRFAELNKRMQLVRSFL